MNMGEKRKMWGNWKGKLRLGEQLSLGGTEKEVKQSFVLFFKQELTVTTMLAIWEKNNKKITIWTLNSKKLYSLV